MRCLTTTRLTEERSSTDPVTGVTTTWTEITRPEAFGVCPGVAAGPGGGRPWDLHVFEGDPVSLQFRASGAIARFRITEETRAITPGTENFNMDFLERLELSDKDLKEGKVPHKKLASVFSENVDLTDRNGIEFDASQSAVYVLEVTGADGNTNECAFALNVNDMQGNEAGCSAGGAGELNAAGCGNAMDSFVGSTEILMADGTNKTIDSVKKGDFVWNPILEKPMKVSSIASREDLVGLIEVIYGDRELTVTRNHPIATVNRGYVPAVRLKRGDIIFMASGESGEITRINNVSGKGLQGV